MGVIVNELEVVIEAPSPEEEPVPSEQASPDSLGKPVPRVLLVQDLNEIRWHQDARAHRLAAD
jgi:hypothetical protein